MLFLSVKRCEKLPETTAVGSVEGPPSVARSGLSGERSCFVTRKAHQAICCVADSSRAVLVLVDCCNEMMAPRVRTRYMGDGAGAVTASQSFLL